ncbi:MAG: autotransporter assembly complex family protein [Sideroxyarcus sp.]|nr:autotransporter assembly complex family protein [Sideroxyarcus sp.]
MTMRLTHVLLLLAVLDGNRAWALTVGVDAPESVRPMLVKYLETARAARQKEQPDEMELARLRAQSLATAKELLATEGYFSPRIDTELKRRDGEWQLQYRVDPGPRTLVRAVVIEFAGDLAGADADKPARQEAIRQSFALKPGMPFRQSDWDVAKTMLLRALVTDTYPAGVMTASEARIDPGTQSAHLMLRLESGPAFHYGAETVTGNMRYPLTVISALSPLKPGQPYRLQDVLDYKTALESSGYYAQATVRVDADPANAAAAPISVQVVEHPEKRFSVGIGASTDSGPRVQFGFLQRNLMDQALRLNFDARVEKEQQSGETVLAWPRDAGGYENSIGFRLKHEDIEGQQVSNTLFNGKRSRIQGLNEVTLSLQYHTETQEVGNVLSNRNQALIGNYAFTRRTSGKAFYPRRGYVLNLQAGGATQELLSDTSFFRLYGRHTQFLVAGKDGRLVARAELGSVIAESRNGIPTDFLFRAGGDNSVRGYAYQSLGRDLSGGIASVAYLVTGSVEYNYFFNQTWGAALFVDAGDAADSPAALNPVVGSGLGMRYRSPVGPINVDIAYGRATQRYRLHFSLGAAF